MGKGGKRRGAKAKRGASAEGWLPRGLKASQGMTHKEICQYVREHGYLRSIEQLSQKAVDDALCDDPQEHLELDVIRECSPELYLRYARMCVAKRSVGYLEQGLNLLRRALQDERTRAEAVELMIDFDRLIGSEIRDVGGRYRCEWLRLAFQRDTRERELLVLLLPYLSTGRRPEVRVSAASAAYTALADRPYIRVPGHQKLLEQCEELREKIQARIDEIDRAKRDERDPGRGTRRGQGRPTR